MTKASGAGTPFVGQSGFGKRPALIVIDFCNGYTTEGAPLYCGDPEIGVVPAVARSVELLEAARAAELPVIFTRVCWQPGTGDGGIFTQKVPLLLTLTDDNPATHIVPSLKPKDTETVMIKKYPSCFFGTPLAPQLTALGVDTVLLIGCSTSGCIRASALDAMQHGFRCVVVSDCVGDRTKAVHDANLHDIQAKIGDVLPKARVLELIHSLSGDEPSAKRAKTNGGIDGVADFKKGQRDFSVNQGHTLEQQKYDFDSPTKVFTNGITAANQTKTIVGGLTGRTFRIPDVNSAYPKCLMAKPDTWLDLGKDGFPDFLENRRKFMVVIPSTNTTVEHDFWRITFTNNLKGVGYHSSPIIIASPKLACDEDMLEFLRQFRREILKTIDVGMTAEPEYIIMGMSLETFFGGWEGNREFMEEIEERSGLNVATGAEACKYALEKFNAKTISVITPYQEIGDKNVVKFFEEVGFAVKAIHGFKCGSATDIAHVPESCCEEVIRRLAKDKPDAIVQCGTNLSMVAIADKLEQELGIPIIPINAATLWFALRENGITEKLHGCTRLCREF